ncbi:MAG: type II secretion system protein [Candidatus Omnitrophota bacterium]
MRADGIFSEIRGAPGAKGFTLVELIISIAVMSILAGMATQTFRVVLQARDIAIKRLEISETARAALDYISTDLRSAYLTPDSIESLTGAAGTSLSPRFRFAGIYRDEAATADNGVPGAGVDDDGDGLIDEEILDGVDGDYSSGAADTLKNPRSRPVADPRGCEDGDTACIDEDIGLFPSDILHFVSAVENSGDLILQEISYGLDPSGTKLIRRGQILTVESGSSSSLIDLMDFGQFVDDTTKKPLLPSPVLPGMIVNTQEVIQAIDNWDTGSKYGSIQAKTHWSNQNPGKIFQVLAYDVRGLRFRYWYYDYNRGGWRWAKEWDSARETALMEPGQLLFKQTALNNSIEGRNRTSFENIIVNEADDMYPRVAGTVNQFLIKNPLQLISSPQYVETKEHILNKMDGLPNMVEITIYVQDRQRIINPRPYTLRVFIPNNYRSIGL